MPAATIALSSRSCLSGSRVSGLFCTMLTWTRGPGSTTAAIPPEFPETPAFGVASCTANAFVMLFAMPLIVGTTDTAFSPRWRPAINCLVALAEAAAG